MPVSVNGVHWVQQIHMKPGNLKSLAAVQELYAQQMWFVWGMMDLTGEIYSTDRLQPW